MSLEAFAEEGRFDPSRIATALRTTLDEVARTVGLGRDAVMRQDRIASPKTQRRLREMVEILNRVEPRFGSALIAYAWYWSEPLAGFGRRTAMQLVREGHAADVREYIDVADAGIHAWPMHYRGLLYRALNLIRAREPLSGEGARLHGGRFNPKGIPALCTALSVMTAIREANQIGTLQPTTLVCYEADITPVFDESILWRWARTTCRPPIWPPKAGDCRCGQMARRRRRSSLKTDRRRLCRAEGAELCQGGEW